MKIKFKNKNILVYGYVKSGKECVSFLSNMKSNVYLYDDNEIKETLKGCEIINNTETFDFSIFALVVVSPGVNTETSFVAKTLKDLNIPIISEIELAFYYAKGKIFAITGTNGKTTTTSFLYHIFKCAKKNAFLAGNVGIPFISVARKTKRSSFIALEISSFQLEHCYNFRPTFSAFLNFSEDHMDRHKTLENYFSLKSKMIINSDDKSYSVLNFNDGSVKKLSLQTKSKCYFFSLTDEIKGAYLKGKEIYFKDVNDEYVCSIAKTKLLGQKNYENILAAVCLAKLGGIRNEAIEKAIETFYPLAHRLETVGLVNGIKFINDSKGTNINSTMTALDAISQPIILMIGGLGKGQDFSLLFNYISDNVKKIILFGKDRDYINSFEKNKDIKKKIVLVSNFDEAFKSSLKFAQKEYCVLLSPACASFDEFDNYEHRGKHFTQLVRDFENNNF